jgi:general secretion pathway protein H
VLCRFPQRKPQISDTESPAGNLTGSPRETGFTLIELCVILLLIGIFSGLLVPNLDRIGQGDLDASARRLRGTVKYLYNEAALTGREHRLIYDLDHGTYRAMILQPDGELVDLQGTGKGAKLPEGVRIRELTLRGHGSFSSGEIMTRIHPTGWLEETIIHLQDQAGKQLTLRIAPLSGITDIYPGNKVFSP